MINDEGKYFEWQSRLGDRHGGHFEGRKRIATDRRGMSGRRRGTVNTAILSIRGEDGGGLEDGGGGF